MDHKKAVESELAMFGIPETAEVQPYGDGLINHTWLVTDGEQKYIFQRINSSVFKNPPDIAYNVQLVGKYLKKKFPDYFFIEPIKTLSGDVMAASVNGWFRMYHFLEGSHTINVVQNTRQAFEAAQQFGRFVAHLANFRALKLKTTIPDFHNLELRYLQFEQALKNASPERASSAEHTIDALKKHRFIANTYAEIVENPRILKRATHHDTKISNVLFDEHDRGMGVIDLDTLMPGYFISDFGDMMRTYLCPVSEEETDLSKIEIRNDYYFAIRDGYMSEMGPVLLEEERQYLYYSGIFLTYMQALRFLSDYLNNDVYYGAKYPAHNLVRAGNQFRLLECMLEKETTLNK